MKIIYETEIDGSKIKILSRNLDEILKEQKQENNFKGQKIFHPFKTKKINQPYSFKDKRGTIKNRTRTCLVYDNSFESPEIQNLIKEAREIQFKHDGACGYMYYDSKEKYVPYTRYDIKKDKKTGLFKEAKPEWIPCQDKPDDPEATHYPHFRSCFEENNDYKWQLEAFKKFCNSDQFTKHSKSFTCEFMGRKFNYKKSDPVDDDASIVPHGSIILEIPKELRTYDGFLKIFKELPFIEGFVVYCNNNSIFKIRREMYVDNDGKKLEWGNYDFTNSQFKKIVESFSGFSDSVAIK